MSGIGDKMQGASNWNKLKQEAKGHIERAKAGYEEISSKDGTQLFIVCCCCGKCLDTLEKCAFCEEVKAHDEMYDETMCKNCRQAELDGVLDYAR